MIENAPITLAIIGGSGALGRGLAARWLRAGYDIVIGSRSVEKAKEAATELRERTGIERVEGTDNQRAAMAGNIVVLTVPFEAHDATLAAIKPLVRGKIVVDTTVPLKPPKVGRVSMPPEGSAAQIAQRSLGDDVTVIAAFHNVAAAKLLRSEIIDCDVLVCGDDAIARDRVIALARAAGLRGLHAGPLANAAATEAMTSILISINRSYRIDGSGLRITGALPEEPGRR